MLTEEHLAQIADLLKALPKGELVWAKSKSKTQGENVQYYIDALKASDNTKVDMVLLRDDPEKDQEGDLVAAITGNGPNSEVLAKFFSMTPRVVRELLAEVHRLRKELHERSAGEYEDPQANGEDSPAV